MRRGRKKKRRKKRKKKAVEEEKREEEKNLFRFTIRFWSRGRAGWARYPDSKQERHPASHTDLGALGKSKGGGI